jgi:GT2 family glycosyltransferase
MNLTFLILTWNSQRDIEECINSIVDCCTQDAVEFKITVVDNGSTDATPEILARLDRNDDRIHTTCLPKNIGTTRPRNAVLKKLDAEFVCILDADTKIVDGSIKSLLDYLKQNKDVGLVAPKLILRDGSVQNSVKKFPTLTEKILKGLSATGVVKYNVNDFYEEFPFETIKAVDTAISACWIIPTSLLKTIGYLDEKIFYSPEDIDFSLRVWKSGKKLVYYPEFTVLHKTQQISHARPLGKIALTHLWGLIYYFAKHKYWLSRTKIYKEISAVIPGYPHSR